MSLIKASLAAAIKAMNSAGKELVEDYVPAPVPEVPVPKEKPVAPPPEVSGPISELADEAVIEQVVPPAATLPEPEPEPEVAEEVPSVEVFFDSEVLEPEPVKKMALRSFAPLKSTTQSTALSPKLQAALTSLQTAMTNFAPVFNNGVDTIKVQEAELADNALALSNLTNAAQISLMEADLNAHKATDGASHNLTPLQAGTYSQTQVNTQVAARPAYSSFPVSRYGELSYLPIGVSGSFQGATMNFENRRYPGIIEDDGTYVFLRNGTTGSSEGVYYAYMKNALNAVSMVVPTRTNFRYQPSFFPSGSTARWVTKSDGACILGRLQTSAGALSDYFLSITNGTFDATKHVGGIIPAASFPPLLDVSCNIEAIVGNTNIYIIVTGSAAVIQPVEFQIWSIPIATVRAANGGNITPTQITGWTTTGFGSTFSTTNLRVANCHLSTNASDLPIVVQPSTPSMSTYLFVDNNGNINTDSAQDPVTGNLRIRVMGESFVSVASSGYAVNFDINFWINANPTAKTAALEGPATAPGTLVYNSGPATATYTGGMYTTVSNNIIPQSYQGGESTNVWTPGYWFSITDSDPPDYQANIARAQSVGTYTNRYQALVPTAGVVNHSSTPFFPSYGTPLGGRMTGCWMLPSGYLMVASYGPRADGVTMELGPVMCQLGASGYSYQSQYNGTLSGYAPAPIRQRISDMGQNPDSFACMVSETAASGTVTASGGYFLEGFNTNGFASIVPSGSNLVGSGSISLSSAVMQAIKGNCWATLGIAAPPSSSLELVIPQNTTIPAFGLMTYCDASKNLFVALFEFTITGGNRTGVIAGMTAISTSGALQTDTGSVINPLTDSTIWTTGSVHIYEGSDAWFVGWGSKTYLTIPGTGAGHMLRFAIPKSSNRPSWSTKQIDLVGITYNANFYMGFPGVGFGYAPQSPNPSDNYTKLTFIPTCTTLAQYSAWTAIGAQRVLVSQDVATGWNVYFTDNQPLIMNGKYYTMVPAQVNLTTIQANPANATFYVYIVITGGVPAYVIRTTDQAESPTVLFIGTIVTGATGITATNMVKVTRLGGYRVTATKSGTAIPVSSGTPDASSTLIWK